MWTSRYQIDLVTVVNSNRPIQHKFIRFDLVHLKKSTTTAWNNYFNFKYACEMAWVCLCVCMRFQNIVPHRRCFCCDLIPIWRFFDIFFVNIWYSRRHRFGREWKKSNTKSFSSFECLHAHRIHSLFVYILTYHVSLEMYSILSHFEEYKYQIYRLFEEEPLDLHELKGIALRWPLAKYIQNFHDTQCQNS